MTHTHNNMTEFQLKLKTLGSNTNSVEITVLSANALAKYIQTIKSIFEYPNFKNIRFKNSIIIYGSNSDG